MDHASELSAAFKASLRSGVAMPEADPGAAIAALFRAGQSVFPAVHVDAITLARHLGERCSSERAALPPPSFAADVYLACACVVGAPRAHDTFVRCYSQVIIRAVARVDRSPAFVEDVRQEVFVCLFCAPPSAVPKIAEYEGRAPLRAFLRIVAGRTALNHLRRQPDAAPVALDVDREVAASVDVELAYLKARYKADFEAASCAAVGRLEPRQRALLRMHIEGRSIDVLGAYFEVARATAARWLREARQALRDGTRAELGLTESQYASVAELIRSRLDVSVTSLLRE